MGILSKGVKLLLALLPYNDDMQRKIMRFYATYHKWEDVGKLNKGGLVRFGLFPFPDFKKSSFYMI